MDLSGRTSMDLTEAARLMKQSSTSSTATNPAQMQPPPLVMMQQAVAMQQFQFQQALLMQQVMASQQAAARAATVKSAAEMAAARAAEISKQLKGSDAEEEEIKPAAASPGRSKSRSLSRSRSASRSKSRSPIRYRRDRSLSRSPIRYRRDRQYSPSRSRDYYSYRSRSRRGYYRGRGDYPWNPYRREWERDRDRDRDYYPRSRRSRSRSRSRVRRRSRTRSRSPRFRRERSASPRHRREERRLTRSSRRSRSRETKRSESSRSPSASPRRIENSRSPLRKVQDSDRGVIRQGASESPIPRIGRRSGKDLSISPVREDQIVSPDTKERGSFLQREESLKKGTYRDSELPRSDTSVTPPRSLSVSLNQSLRKDLESDEEMDVSSKANKGSIGLLGIEYSGDGEADELDVRPGFPQNIKAHVSSSDVSSDEINGDDRRNGQLVGNPSRTLKREERSVKGPEFTAGEDSEEDKGLDDWHLSRERIGRKDGRRDHERKVEEERKPSKKEVPLFLERSRVGSVQGQLDSNKGNKKHDSDIDMEQPELESIHERKARTDAGRKELKRQESFRYRGRQPLIDNDEWNDLKERERHSVLPGEDIEEQVEEVATYPSKEDEEQDEDEERVFQAPIVPTDAFEKLEATVRPTLVEDYKDVERVDGRAAGTRSWARDVSDLEDEEVKVPRGRSVLEEEDMPVSRKGKEKRSRDRRLDDEEERDKRKERHKKHRKKHRRDEEDEKDEEDEEKDDGESRKARRRHKRRHRNEDEDDRRDRKRRKHRSHKSRGKSMSDSAGESPRADVDAGRDEKAESPIRKKSSSRHRKRRREPSKSPAISGSSSE